VALAGLVLAGIAVSPVSPAVGARTARAPQLPLNGIWKVRQDTVVGYRAREELFGAAAPHDVVGRTSVVSGKIALTRTALATATVTADMRTLQSNDGTRDADLRSRYFNAHPRATFKLRQPIPLAGIKPGQVRTADAQGALTVHGVTKDVSFKVWFRHNGPTFQIVGSSRQLMTDFGMEPPSEAGIATIEDAFTIEVRVVLVRTKAAAR
jgi:polyisoprenoid-binding protein YceI